MKIAVLSDVHGNLPALQAALEDIERRNIRHTAYLGDLALLGLYPQECFDLLTRYDPTVWIKGNADEDMRCVLSPPPQSTFGQWLKSVADYAVSRLADDSIDYLNKLAICMPLQVEGVEITFCHGSPYNVSEHLVENLAPETATRVEEDKYRHIFCGHTHTEKTFFIGSCVITNFGAVGYSFDGDVSPRYGIITIRENGRPTSETVRVGYDSTGYKAQIKKENPPFRENLLHALEHGRPLPFARK